MTDKILFRQNIINKNIIIEEDLILNTSKNGYLVGNIKDIDVEKKIKSYYNNKIKIIKTNDENILFYNVE